MIAKEVAQKIHEDIINKDSHYLQCMLINARCDTLKIDKRFESQVQELFDKRAEDIKTAISEIFNELK